MKPYLYVSRILFLQLIPPEKVIANVYKKVALDFVWGMPFFTIYYYGLYDSYNNMKFLARKRNIARIVNVSITLFYILQGVMSIIAGYFLKNRVKKIFDTLCCIKLRDDRFIVKRKTIIKIVVSFVATLGCWLFLDYTLVKDRVKTPIFMTIRFCLGRIFKGSIIIIAAIFAMITKSYFCNINHHISSIFTTEDVSTMLFELCEIHLKLLNLSTYTCRTLNFHTVTQISINFITILDIFNLLLVWLKNAIENKDGLRNWYSIILYIEWMVSPILCILIMVLMYGSLEKEASTFHNYNYIHFNQSLKIY